MRATMKPMVPAYSAIERAREGCRGRYRHAMGPSALPRPRRRRRPTGNAAGRSHQGLTFTSRRIPSRKEVADPNQNAKVDATTTPYAVACRLAPSAGCGRSSARRTIDTRTRIRRKYVARGCGTMRAPDTRRAGRTALGSLGIRMKRRNPEKTRRSPRVDGAAWEVEYAWGIATATNAAAKRATFVSRDSRAARRNTGSATRAPRVGTRRLRTTGTSRPAKATPAPWRKNPPGKNGYVPPQPTYSVETLPLTVRSRRIE